MAATALGKFLRKIRVDNDERLYDMAKRVEVSSAFLSGVENGRKKASSSLIEKIISEYKLNLQEQKQLQDAISISEERYLRDCLDSISEEKIDISQFSPKKQEATLMFARKFDDLSDKQLEQIKSILKGDKNND